MAVWGEPPASPSLTKQNPNVGGLTAIPGLNSLNLIYIYINRDIYIYIKGGVAYVAINRPITRQISEHSGSGH